MEDKGLAIKKRIINALSEEEMSLRKLETKARAGSQSIKKHCRELDFLNIIKIIQHNRNSTNGRPYRTAGLTEQGKKLSGKLSKKK